MTKPPLILLLTDDSQRREKWLQVLAEGAMVCTHLALLQTGEMEAPELIVTDRLPITQTLGPANARLACGEIGLVGIGTQGSGDVVLPEECTRHELQLACRLLVEIVRLRRRLAEELHTQRALRSLAYRDPLTGLANRRQWDQELVARMKQLAVDPPVGATAIVLLDLDHFKPINDRLGHVAGDLVLQRVAQRLAANVAQQHLVARLGGDEFGILVHGVLAADVPEIVESIRRAIEHRPEVGGPEEPCVTASAGVAVLLPPLSLRPLEVTTIADAALREAKRTGRCRAVVRQIDGTH